MVYCFIPRISNAGLSSLLFLLVFALRVFFTWQTKNEKRTDVYRVMSIDFLYIYIYSNVVGLVARVVIVILSFSW